MAGQLRIFVKIDDYVNAVQDAERIERQSVLNNEKDDVDHYANARLNVLSKLKALQLLAEEGEIYQNESSLLTELTAAELSALDNCANVQRTQGGEAAFTLLRQRQAQQLLSQIESQAGRIRAEEQREFDDAAHDAEWAANLRTKAFIIGFLANVLCFVWAYKTVITELRRQRQFARYMAILQSVAVRCTRAGDDFDDCLHEILKAAKALTNATKGTIQTLDESGSIRLIAHEGLSAECLEKGKNLTNNDGKICRLHLQGDQHIIVENVSASETIRESPWRELFLGAGVQSFVVTPLISSSGNLLGVITTGFAHTGRPTETQMRFLDLLARETADYLERKQIEKKLEHAHAQLANRAVHLDELVKERTARLQEMINDLEALSYSLVHDMRGPLRAMQTFAEVLKEDCRQLGPIAQGYIHRIQVASQRIDHLLRDALYYSRFMRDEMPVCCLNPKELLLGIVETYPEFERWQKSISICGEFPWVQANEAALTQCFSHLLDNALKFVPAGTKPDVVVWCERRNNRVRIYFRDNGVGIKREACQKVFRIFQKLDHEHRGTGIGLSIVKKAVERMGGFVGVVSDLGQGSIFWLELLRADAHTNSTQSLSRLQPSEAA